MQRWNLDSVNRQRSAIRPPGAGKTYEEPETRYEALLRGMCGTDDQLAGRAGSAGGKSPGLARLAGAAGNQSHLLAVGMPGRTSCGRSPGSTVRRDLSFDFGSDNRVAAAADRPARNCERRNRPDGQYGVFQRRRASVLLDGQ